MENRSSPHLKPIPLPLETLEAISSSEGTSSTTCSTPVSLPSPSISQDIMQDDFYLEGYTYQDGAITYTDPHSSAPRERCVLTAPTFISLFTEALLTSLYPAPLLARILHHEHYKSAEVVKWQGMLSPWCIVRVNNALMLHLDAKLCPINIDLLRVLEKVTYSSQNKKIHFSGLAIDLVFRGQYDEIDQAYYLEDINSRCMQILNELFQDYPANYDPLATSIPRLMSRQQKQILELVARAPSNDPAYGEPLKSSNWGAGRLFSRRSGSDSPVSQSPRKPTGEQPSPRLISTVTPRSRNDDVIQRSSSCPSSPANNCKQNTQTMWSPRNFSATKLEQSPASPKCHA